MIRSVIRTAPGNHPARQRTTGGLAPIAAATFAVGAVVGGGTGAPVVAPADGVVHELKVYTVGGVVPPQSTIMQIVPVAEGVEFEVRVPPKEIDQSFVGQKAKVQFPAFDMRSSPVLYGSLAGISPSTIVDPAKSENPSL